jgi:hypothetical protein
MSKFTDLLNKLNIDETYTKPIKAKPILDSVKENTLYQVPNMNYMADTLWLPETKEGYHFLLVLVDLGTNKFDMEPMIGDTIKSISPNEALEAMQTIFKRRILTMPVGSIRTDGGNEFKGAFEKYCYNNNILLRKAISGRHKQLSNADSLCRQLGRLLNGYMNHMEKKTKKTYREWTDVIDVIRKDLNNIRSVKDFKHQSDIKTNDVIMIGNKYNIGDSVFRKLEKPQTALGKYQNTSNFREGDYRWDTKPRLIKRVLNYPNQFRYILEGIKTASFTEQELMPSKKIEEIKQYNDNNEEILTVKAIIGKKIIKKKLHYLVWWEGFKKSESTFEPEDNLIEDGLQDYIDDYNENN